MLKKVPTHFHLHAVLEYLEIQFPELVDVTTGDMAHTYRFDLFGPGPRMSVIYPLSANIGLSLVWSTRLRRTKIKLQILICLKELILDYATIKAKRE